MVPTPRALVASSGSWINVLIPIGQPTLIIYHQAGNPHRLSFPIILALELSPGVFRLVQDSSSITPADEATYGEPIVGIDYGPGALQEKDESHSSLKLKISQLFS